MTHRSRFVLLCALAAALSAVVATQGSALAAHRHPAPKVYHVKIVADPNTVGAYRPRTITVHRGQKIVFSNVSNAVHTVTADNGKSFDSKDIHVGKSWTYTAKHTGTFKYHCIYHLLMVGTIIVKP